MNKLLKGKKTKIKRIEKVNKISGIVKDTRETIGEVESIQRIISDTLYIRDDIAVDLKNFSLISIPDATKKSKNF